MDLPFRGRDGEMQRARAAMRDPRTAGVVVAGPAYVGRTRFLAELVGSLGGRQGQVVEVAATRSSRDVPYGVLGRWAPADATPDTALDRFVEAVGGPGTVVAVDDVQWVDDRTAALLFEAARQQVLTLVLALRRGHQVPHAVSTLVKDDLVGRIDLRPLDRRASDEIVEAALGSRVAAAVLHDLWDLCGGFPLLLRYFLGHAVDTGALVLDKGTWLAAAELEAPPALVDEVRSQLHHFGPVMTEAIQLIALGEPLEPEIVDRLVDPETLASIERASVTVQDPVTGRYRISTLGACMAIRAALEPAVMRSLSRRLSGAMLDTGLHEDDLVRLAIWRLDAGDTTDNSLLVRAAERAASTFDHELTERMARAAIPGGGVEARILLANALIHQYRHDEAEEQLALAAEEVDSDEHRARVAGVRSRLLFFRLGRMEEACEVLEEACEAVEDADVVDQLRGSLALLVSMLGDLDQAVDLCELVLDRDTATAPAKAIASMSAGFARVMRGDLTEALRTCEDGLALPTGPVVRDYPLARPLLELTAMMADGYLGRFDVAERRARSGYRASLESGSDEVTGVWATQIAGLMLYRGDLGESLRYSAEARRLLSVADTLGVHSLAYALAATALAESGQVDEAREMLDGLVEVRQLYDVRARIQEHRAQAAVVAAAGELESAAQMVREAAEEAFSYDHRTWGVFTAHQAIRLGYPERVLDLLAEVEPCLEGPLLQGIAAHGRALAARDVDALEEVGGRFSTIGATLWAAEAFAQGSRAASEAGSPQRAALLRGRAGALLERCPEAATPAIRGLQVTPLTRREHEIAILAASGLTSREIAERLVVSPRTVDNHLASVYRKLEVSGRDALRSVLAVEGRKG